jgi:gamma-glutamyl hercynylcysteine S-oxide synthase
MILIPAGPFLMGTSLMEAEKLAKKYGHHPSWLSGETPERKVVLPAFRVDKYPVTIRRFLAYVQATGAKTPFDWVGGKPTEPQLDLPVRNIDREAARAFAKWSGKRLPKAAEWEKAARGIDGRLFPWGNQFDPEACCHDRGGVTPPTGPAPANAHPRGASPYGVMDLIGNIAEYCDDGPGPGSAYVKGGCWLTSSPLNLRCAAVGMSGFSNNALDYLGFRCAQDA